MPSARGTGGSSRPRSSRRWRASAILTMPFATTTPTCWRWRPNARGRGSACRGGLHLASTDGQSCDQSGEQAQAGGHSEYLAVLLKESGGHQPFQVIDAGADVGIGELRRAEDLMKSIQAVRGQGGQADEHPHGPREDDQARGETVVLGAGELQDPGRKWCDDDA